jgi:hypothetical protein
MGLSNIEHSISTAVLNMVFIFGITAVYDIVCQNRASEMGGAAGGLTDLLLTGMV